MKLIVNEYLTPEGVSPFRKWLDTLDNKAKARVQARIFRFEMGNLGDHKSVGDGVWEARLAFGPGYRIYFGKQGKKMIILLLGGDKSTQKKDIPKAKKYWKDFLEVMEHGKAE